MSTILTPTDGANVVMTITSLNSLVNSATAGWQSIRVDNTSLLASDFRIGVKLAAVNTAPGSDKCVYIYALPWYWDGSTWYAPDGGTTTLPAGTQGTYTIALPSNLGPPLGILNYTTQNQIMQGTFKLSSRFGLLMPQGWSLVVINFCGITIAASGNLINYIPVTFAGV